MTELLEESTARSGRGLGMPNSGDLERLSQVAAHDLANLFV